MASSTLPQAQQAGVNVMVIAGANDRPGHGAPEMAADAESSSKARVHTAEDFAGLGSAAGAGSSWLSAVTAAPTPPPSAAVAAISRKLKLPTSKETRARQIRAALLSAAGFEADAGDSAAVVLSSPSRHAVIPLSPQAVAGALGAAHASHDAAATGTIDAGLPLGRTVSLSEKAKLQRFRAVGRRELCEEESGAHALRLRIAQAARDLALVRKGKCRVADIAALPPTVAGGRLGMTADGGASTLAQSAALAMAPVAQADPHSQGSSQAADACSREGGIGIGPALVPCAPAEPDKISLAAFGSSQAAWRIARQRRIGVAAAFQRAAQEAGSRGHGSSGLDGGFAVGRLESMDASSNGGGDQSQPAVISARSARSRAVSEGRGSDSHTLTSGRAELAGAVPLPTLPPGLPHTPPLQSSRTVAGGGTASSRGTLSAGPAAVGLPPASSAAASGRSGSQDPLSQLRSVAGSARGGAGPASSSRSQRAQAAAQGGGSSHGPSAVSRIRWSIAAAGAGAGAVPTGSGVGGDVDSAGGSAGGRAINAGPDGALRDLMSLEEAASTMRETLPFALSAFGKLAEGGLGLNLALLDELPPPAVTATLLRQDAAIVGSSDPAEDDLRVRAVGGRFHFIVAAEERDHDEVSGGAATTGSGGTSREATGGDAASSTSASPPTALLQSQLEPTGSGQRRESQAADVGIGKWLDPATPARLAEGILAAAHSDAVAALRPTPPALQLPLGPSASSENAPVASTQPQSQPHPLRLYLHMRTPDEAPYLPLDNPAAPAAPPVMWPTLSATHLAVAETRAARFGMGAHGRRRSSATSALAGKPASDPQHVHASHPGGTGPSRSGSIAGHGAGTGSVAVLSSRTRRVSAAASRSASPKASSRTQGAAGMHSPASAHGSATATSLSTPAHLPAPPASVAAAGYIPASEDPSAAFMRFAAAAAAEREKLEDERRREKAEAEAAEAAAEAAALAELTASAPLTVRAGPGAEAAPVIAGGSIVRASAPGSPTRRRSVQPAAVKATVAPLEGSPLAGASGTAATTATAPKNARSARAAARPTQRRKVGASARSTPTAQQRAGGGALASPAQTTPASAAAVPAVAKSPLATIPEGPLVAPTAVVAATAPELEAGSFAAAKAKIHRPVQARLTAAELDLSAFDGIKDLGHLLPQLAGMTVDDLRRNLLTSASKAAASAAATAPIATPVRGDHPSAAAGDAEGSVTGPPAPAIVSRPPLSVADLMALTRLAHDRALAARLASMTHDRARTLALKAAALDRLLQRTRGAVAIDPGEHIRFLRFDAEAGRVVSTQNNAATTLPWYAALLEGLAAAQPLESTHPAQRYILHRVQHELAEGRDISAELLEKLLVDLAVPDVLSRSSAAASAARATGVLSAADGRGGVAAATAAAAADARANTGAIFSVSSFASATSRSALGAMAAAVAAAHQLSDRIRARAAKSAVGNDCSPAVIAGAGTGTSAATAPLQSESPVGGQLQGQSSNAEDTAAVQDGAGSTAQPGGDAEPAGVGEASPSTSRAAAADSSSGPAAAAGAQPTARALVVDSNMLLALASRAHVPPPVAPATPGSAAAAAAAHRVESGRIASQRHGLGRRNTGRRSSFASVDSSHDDAASASVSASGTSRGRRGSTASAISSRGSTPTAHAAAASIDADALASGGARPGSGVSRSARAPASAPGAATTSSVAAALTPQPADADALVRRLTSLQLLQVQLLVDPPLLVQHAGVQALLAFLRRIAGISLLELDAMHARAGLLPHAASLELILQRAALERRAMLQQAQAQPRGDGPPSPTAAKSAAPAGTATADSRSSPTSPPRAVATPPAAASPHQQLPCRPYLGGVLSSFYFDTELLDAAAAAGVKPGAFISVEMEDRLMRGRRAPVHLQVDAQADADSDTAAAGDSAARSMASQAAEAAAAASSRGARDPATPHPLLPARLYSLAASGDIRALDADAAQRAAADVAATAAEMAAAAAAARRQLRAAGTQALRLAVELDRRLSQRLEKRARSGGRRRRGSVLRVPIPLLDTTSASSRRSRSMSAHASARPQQSTAPPAPPQQRPRAASESASTEAVALQRRRAEALQARAAVAASGGRSVRFADDAEEPHRRGRSGSESEVAGAAAAADGSSSLVQQRYTSATDGTRAAAAAAVDVRSAASAGSDLPSAHSGGSTPLASPSCSRSRTRKDEEVADLLIRTRPSMVGGPFSHSFHTAPPKRPASL